MVTFGNDYEEQFKNQLKAVFKERIGEIKEIMSVPDHISRMNEEVTQICKEEESDKLVKE